MTDICTDMTIVMLGAVLLLTGSLFVAMRWSRRAMLREAEAALGNQVKATVSPGEPVVHAIGEASRFARYIIRADESSANAKFLRALRRDMCLEWAYSACLFLGMVGVRAVIAMFCGEPEFWGVGHPFSFLLSVLAVAGLVQTIVGICLEWQGTRGVQWPHAGQWFGWRWVAAVEEQDASPRRKDWLVWGSWSIDSGTGVLRSVAVLSMIITAGRLVLH